MIDLTNLSVVMGGHALLNNISLQFPPGQLTVIVGPNGAGKSTLMKCIDGEIATADGTITLNEKPLDQWTNLELARIRSVLPQQSSLTFPFTVEDVALMGRIPHQTSHEENRQIAMRALDLCDCSDLIHRSYTTLSGGEQQRVQLARIFTQIEDQSCQHDRYLFLDEPVSALDLNHQYALMRNLRRYADKQNIGVICILHNLNLAAQFAARVIILDEGRVVADGPPSDVFTEETLSHVFNLNISVSHHPEDNQIPLIIPKLSESGDLFHS